MPRASKMRACRTCLTVVNSKEEPCPECRKTDHMSPNFSGLLIIYQPEKSKIAKKIGHTKPGMYAIRVRQ